MKHKTGGEKVYEQTCAFSSNPLLKFFSNSWRTGSNPSLTNPVTFFLPVIFCAVGMYVMFVGSIAQMRKIFEKNFFLQFQLPYLLHPLTKPFITARSGSKYCSECSCSPRLWSDAINGVHSSSAGEFWGYEVTGIAIVTDGVHPSLQQLKIWLGWYFGV